jgi:uncharacterized protein (DUF849 family)/N-acetylglutamate synthase-like GNAT family acetyltransferase
MEYILEPASPKDREAILQVMKIWNMHHVPSPEMEELDLRCFFVAKVDGKIVGASGYKILTDTSAETTLLGIYPNFQGFGIGKALQDKRIEAMYDRGIKKVTTYSDRPEVILWYKKHYGYREVGHSKKMCKFGLEDVDYWRVLEMDLDSYMHTKESNEKRRESYIQNNDPAPLSDYPPLIINVCLSGMLPSKTHTSYVPVGVDEIIEDAVRVYDAGASIVHIHARDGNGSPTPDAQTYEKIIEGIRQERPDLICCATTSGRNWSDVERRSEVLELTGRAKPDMASLTLGSLNFLTGASVNSIDTIQQLVMKMKEKEIMPELEVFDYGMINLAKYLERHQLIEGKKYFNLLLGNLNSAPATIGSLSALSEALPENSVWAAAGLGRFQLPMNTAAIVGGGHVRVGIEDSIYYDYRQTQLASNETLVKRIVRISNELQREIATAREARSIIGLGAANV